MKYPMLLVILGLVSQRVLPSSHVATTTGNGSVVGVVQNERHEPVVHVVVQAFSPDAPLTREPRQHNAPPIMRPSAPAVVTDKEGRFRISGLKAGEYLVAAEPHPLVPSPEASAPRVYAKTFYPSTVDNREAGRVRASDHAETTVSIELVQVRGARVSGSVVSPSGQPTGGMGVKMYHRFGDFASASIGAIVNPDGKYEISHMPPGWYRLSIDPLLSDPRNARPEFAEKLVEVRDRDLDGVAFLLGPGASISGRVTVAPGAGVRPTGLRVTASPPPEQFSELERITATVGENWSFRMTAPSGFYQFTVDADRSPWVAATRVLVNGAAVPGNAVVELLDGTHNVVLSIAPRGLP